MAEKTAEDIIPLEEFRGFIQDQPQTRIEQDLVGKTWLEVDDPPIYENGVLELRDVENDEKIEDYEVDDYNSGLIDLKENYEQIRIKYQHVQLSDDELETILNDSLIEHDSSLTWDDFYTTDDEEEEKTSEFEEVPFIKLLAASKAYFMLASKWGQETRVQIDDLEVEADGPVNKYLELGRELQNKYQNASGGKIRVANATRRSLETGKKVPNPEDWYNEE